MNKIFLIATILMGSFVLSFFGVFVVFIVFSVLLFSFLTLLLLSSKVEDKHYITTTIYIIFSLVFVETLLVVMLKSNYQKNGFNTIVIMCVLLPTFFLLGYRILLSIHCFLSDIYSTVVKNNNFQQEETSKSCTVILSTRNEPFDVCKMTFDSIHELDYPKELMEIIIIDNSEESFEDYQKWKSYVESFKTVYGDRCKFIHRNGTEGFKPRNLDIAVKSVTSDYVLFVDADSTLPAESLKKGLVEFSKNERLGFVSFLIESTNYGVNLVTKVGSIFQNTIRYLNEFTGRYGYCNYQGHNGIWSKYALDKIGSWEEYYQGQVMVTEDIAAGFRCYEAGLESKPVFIKTGEWVPTSLKEFEKMWLRWSFGGMQVMQKNFIKMMSSAKVAFRVKLDMLYLLFKIAISGFPLFAMFLVIFPRSDLALSIVINITLLPLIILSIWYYIFGDVRGNFISKIFQIYVAMFMLSSFVFWCGIKAEINFYLSKKQTWKPTLKACDKDDSWLSIIQQHAGKLAFSTVGVVIAAYSMATLYNSPDFMIYVFSMLPSILLFVNTILCVFILGKSRTI